MKMFLISDNIDTYTGMRLVGVEGVVVHQKKELENAFKTVFKDPQIGIVLLTEKFTRDFPEYVTQIKMEHEMPLIIDIPDRHGTGRQPDFITAYINEAIGLKL